MHVYSIEYAPFPKGSLIRRKALQKACCLSIEKSKEERLNSRVNSPSPHRWLFGRIASIPSFHIEEICAWSFGSAK